jgi:Ca2+/Na+ antiporter
VIDRRITFFLAAAAVCALMTPLAPGEFKWVPIATALTYVVLAVLVLLESLSGRSRRDRDPS